MKGKIKGRIDHESKIYNNSIEFIKAIKEHAQTYEESRYEMGIILDALRAFINCRQKDKENLQDYTKRFKVAREILHSHLGRTIFLKKFVESMKEYDKKDSDKCQKCIDKADEQLATHVYLVNLIKKNMVQ